MTPEPPIPYDTIEDPRGFNNSFPDAKIAGTAWGGDIPLNGSAPDYSDDELYGKNFSNS